MLLSELVNKAKRALKKQGKYSYDTKSRGCKYRLKGSNPKNPTRCAIGCIISKRVYDKSGGIEQISIHPTSCSNYKYKVYEAIEQTNKVVLTENAKLVLGRLQRLHDEQAGDHPWSVFLKLMDGFTYQDEELAPLS